MPLRGCWSQNISCLGPMAHCRTHLCNTTTSPCFKSWCEFILLICLNCPMQCVTYTDSQEGRVDIWYMRAMINRLIRNGLIKFTLHIKNWKHTSQHLLCAWVCTWLAACVFQPSTYLPAVIRAIFLSDHWAAKRLPETWLFISIPKRAEAARGSCSL